MRERPMPEETATISQPARLPIEGQAGLGKRPGSPACTKCSRLRWREISTTASSRWTGHPCGLTGKAALEAGRAAMTVTRGALSGAYSLCVQQAWSHIQTVR